MKSVDHQNVGVRNVKHIAIVGATGAVGEVMTELLASRDFPVGELTLLAANGQQEPASLLKIKV